MCQVLFISLALFEVLDYTDTKMGIAFGVTKTSKSPNR